eukprot:scaffold166822_cov33-Tisochrysis_lutea.AAC.6
MLKWIKYPDIPLQDDSEDEPQLGLGLLDWVGQPHKGHPSEMGTELPRREAGAMEAGTRRLVQPHETR